MFKLLMKNNYIIFKLVETKKLHVCLKHIPHMTYTLKIYNILHSSSLQRLFFKHIPDVAYTLKIYDVIVQHKEKFV